MPASGLAILERFAHRDPYVQDLPEEKRPLLDELAEADSVDDRHHEEQGSFMLPEVVDRDDRGVIKTGDDLGLGLEPLLRVGCQEGGGDQLDRHITVQLRVTGSVYDAHTPAPQLTEDLVPMGEFCPDQRALSLSHECVRWTRTTAGNRIL